MNQDAKPKLVESVANILTKVRVTLFFFFAYIVVNTIYITILKSYLLDYYLILLISPFNLLEILSKGYSSPTQGLQENFYLVVVIILLAELYSRFASTRLKSSLSIDATFTISIIATYLTSGLWWLATGIPGSGTSIIAFSILLYLFCSSMLDWRHYEGEMRQTSPKSLMVILWASSILVPILLTPNYVFGEHYAIHLTGAAVFGTSVAVYLSLRGSLHSRHKAKDFLPGI